MQVKIQWVSTQVFSFRSDSLAENVNIKRKIRIEEELY